MLFGDGPELLAAIVGAVRSAPEGASPNRVMQAVAERLGALFEVERPHHRQRVRVLAADPALLERDHLKQVAWAQTIGSELIARGLPAGRAVVLASAATATFRTVYVAWATDRSRTKLADRLRMALADLSADLAMTE